MDEMEFGTWMHQRRKFVQFLADKGTVEIEVRARFIDKMFNLKVNFWTQM